MLYTIAECHLGIHTTGILGMMGWAIWYGGVQKSSQVDAFSPSIGYSQGLDIVAWILNMLLAGASFMMLRDAK